MRLQELIDKRLRETVGYNKDRTALGFLRLIKAEIQRASSKEVSDDEVVAIIKGMVKGQEQVIDFTRDIVVASQAKDFVDFAQQFLPAEEDIEVVSEWIEKNIDFSKLKNKMQAVGIVKREFGDAVDAKKVKELIESH